MKVAVMVVALGMIFTPCLAVENELPEGPAKISELVNLSLEAMSLVCVKVLKERDTCMSQEEMLSACGSLREIMTTHVASMEIWDSLGVEVKPFYGSVSLD